MLISRDLEEGIAHIFRVGCTWWDFNHKTRGPCNISMQSVTILKAKKKSTIIKFNDIQNNRKFND